MYAIFYATVCYSALQMFVLCSLASSSLCCCAAVGKQRLSQTQPTPSRSHPSLVHSKLVVASDRSQKKTSSAVSQEKPRSAGSSRTSYSKPNIPVSRTHSKPNVSNSSAKRTEVAAKCKSSKPVTSRKSEGVAKRLSDEQAAALLSSPRSRRRQPEDENIDVTTYLLHRMLGAPAQLPSDGTQLMSAAKKTTKDDDDKHSEAGTYTIDEEEDDAIKQSVQQAREHIDDVFGIGDGTEIKAGDASSHLIRPVIESQHAQQDHGGRSGLGVDVDEDVFIDVNGDDVQRRHYVCTLLTDLFCYNL